MKESRKTLAGPEAKVTGASRRGGAGAGELRSGKVVGAVAGAVKILRYLSDLTEPAGVTRIAKEVRLNTSTCFNILRTLAGEDLVVFDPIGKTYTISLGIMDLAKGATALGSDIGTVKPLMDRIADHHGVTLTLWQPIGKNRKVLILSAVTRSAIRIQMATGQRLPLLIGATGRCFAAFSRLTEAGMRQRFGEIRWDRPLTFKAFRAQVTETAKQGWSIDEGNFAAGTASLAVPVLDSARIAVMAVTATMFSGQYDAGRSKAIVADMLELSRQVERIVAEH